METSQNVHNSGCVSFSVVCLLGVGESFFQKKVRLTLFNSSLLFLPGIYFSIYFLILLISNSFPALTCNYYGQPFIIFHFLSQHFSFHGVLILLSFLTAISFNLIYNLFFKCATLIWNVISVTILRATIQEMLFLLLFDHLPQIIST